MRFILYARMFVGGTLKLENVSISRRVSELAKCRSSRGSHSPEDSGKTIGRIFPQVCVGPVILSAPLRNHRFFPSD